MAFSVPDQKGTATSPADELFYKGKLLPLHLPPRLQMVQKLVSRNNNNNNNNNSLEENMTVNSFEKISPSVVASSCHVSRELSPEDYMCASKKPWSKRLMLIKQSSLSLKLKASKAYLKSLFNVKTGCSNESSSAPTTRVRDCSSGYLKAEKKKKYTNITTLMRRRSIERDKLFEDECLHRKSFSGAINCHLMPKCSPAISSSCSSSSSSSFSSVNSNRFHGSSQTLNRSSSANSEMESSIQGAIAYCKKSQVSARKSVSDAELSLSASRIVAACENDQELSGHCRG